MVYVDQTLFVFMLGATLIAIAGGFWAFAVVVWETLGRRRG